MKNEMKSVLSEDESLTRYQLKLITGDENDKQSK